MFLKGKIKSFSTPRGFGFIEVEGDIDDVFFHIKDLPQNNIEPKIGEVLQFMIVEDQGKFKAGKKRVPKPHHVTMRQGIKVLSSP